MGSLVIRGAGLVVFIVAILNCGHLVGHSEDGRGGQKSVHIVQKIVDGCL
jgi:hypothetical protein